MDLPPEIVDEIIGHLPVYDEKSIRNCSLVAKSWVHPSRRRLFENVHLRPDNLKSWLRHVSPMNVKLLQHVRSLSYRIANTPDLPHGRMDRVDLLRYYSPSFHQLRHLMLSTGCLQSLIQIWDPSAFQHTLSSLSLWFCCLTASTLVTLINYFPNLAQLDLGGLIHEPSDQPIPPLFQPLRKLSVCEFNTYHDMGLLDQLLGLRPRCDEVAVGISAADPPVLAQRVIDGVETTVKRLKFKGSLAGVCNIPMISLRGRSNESLQFHHRSGDPFDSLELPRTP